MWTFPDPVVGNWTSLRPPRHNSRRAVCTPPTHNPHVTRVSIMEQSLGATQVDNRPGFHPPSDGAVVGLGYTNLRRLEARKVPSIPLKKIITQSPSKIIDIDLAGV
jgi:hypothetical protein